MGQHALTHDPRDPSKIVTHSSMTRRPIVCSAVNIKTVLVTDFDKRFHLRDQLLYDGKIMD